MVNLPNIKIIGLTGMSGAGKSTVCEVFRQFGFSVIDCDMISRNVAGDSAFLNELQSRFPEKLLKSDGSLDRAATARSIFTDESKKKLYQQMIFPYIVFGIMRGIRSADRDVLLDAPTLFDAGLEIVCTATVGVTASKEMCVHRIVERDKISPERAAERLAAQHDTRFFSERCDHIIKNNGTVDEFVESAKKIIHNLMAK